MNLGRNSVRETVTLAVGVVALLLLSAMVFGGVAAAAKSYRAARAAAVPVSRYAASDAVLRDAGASRAAILDIAKHLDPNADLVILASQASPVDHGSLYLQLLYFLTPRNVALVECREPLGLAIAAYQSQRLGGVIYQTMMPPAWVSARARAVDISNRAGGKNHALFVPLTMSVKEISSWTQFCR